MELREDVLLKEIDQAIREVLLLMVNPWKKSLFEIGLMKEKLENNINKKMKNETNPNPNPETTFFRGDAQFGMRSKSDTSFFRFMARTPQEHHEQVKELPRITHTLTVILCEKSRRKSLKLFKDSKSEYDVNVVDLNQKLL